MFNVMSKILGRELPDYAQTMISRNGVMVVIVSTIGGDKAWGGELIDTADKGAKERARQYVKEIQQEIGAGQ